MKAAAAVSSARHGDAVAGFNRDADPRAESLVDRPSGTVPVYLRHHRAARRQGGEIDPTILAKNLKPVVAAAVVTAGEVMAVINSKVWRGGRRMMRMTAIQLFLLWPEGGEMEVKVQWSTCVKLYSVGGSSNNRRRRC